MKKSATRSRPLATPASGKPRAAAALLTISRPALLVRGSDAPFRSLVHNLLALGARHDAVRAGHAAFIGLTGVEYTFLVSIGHLGDAGDVSVSSVARHLHLSGPFATITVNKLIQRGLVTKDADPSDRRRARLTLTAAGWALLSQLAPVQRQINDVQFGCLDATEFRLLSDLLARLIDSSDHALRLQAQLVSGTSDE